MTLKRKQIPWQSVENNIVIIQSEENRAHELCEVGSEIWKMLSQPTSAEEIGRQLSEQFDVSETEAQKDAADYLRSLEEQSLLEHC